MSTGSSAVIRRADATAPQKNKPREPAATPEARGRGRYREVYSNDDLAASSYRAGRPPASHRANGAGADSLHSCEQVVLVRVQGPEGRHLPEIRSRPQQRQHGVRHLGAREPGMHLAVAVRGDREHEGRPVDLAPEDVQIGRDLFGTERGFHAVLASEPGERLGCDLAVAGEKDARGTIARSRPNLL